MITLYIVGTLPCTTILWDRITAVKDSYSTLVDRLPEFIFTFDSNGLSAYEQKDYFSARPSTSDGYASIFQHGKVST
jgi:hypothetical protein